MQGKQSFASNYTREPSIKSKGSIPHRQSLKSRRGGGSVAAVGPEPSIMFPAMFRACAGASTASYGWETVC